MRHHHIHRRHQRPVAAQRDHTARGRIGHECVVGRWRPARGPCFFAESESRKTRRRRGARPVGRARCEGGGEIVAIVRAFGTAIDTPLHAAIGHGRHVSEPDEDGAGGTQSLDGESIIACDQPLESGRAGGNGEALYPIAVLGGVGNAIQRTEDLALAAALVGSGR